MGIRSNKSTLSALFLAFTFAAAPQIAAANEVDLSSIQERFEQIERESRLDLVPRDRDGFLDQQRTVSRAQERAFQQISSLLSQNGARLDLMREQIAESMAIENPDLPDTVIWAQANDWLRNYMLEQTSATMDTGTKTPLPEQFARTVRGCTQDGQIYQLSYNIAVDMAALGAFGNDEMTEDESSLFETQVLDTERHFSGVTGTQNYLETLREMNETFHYSMQRLTGGLIDSLPSEEINGETYRALLTTIVENTESGIAENYYNIDIDILVDNAIQLPGECSPAFNGEIEEDAMYMPDPPVPATNVTPTRGAMQSTLAQNTITTPPARPVTPTPPSAYEGMTSDDLAARLNGGYTTDELHGDNRQAAPDVRTPNMHP